MQQPIVQTQPVVATPPAVVVVPVASSRSNRLENYNSRCALCLGPTQIFLGALMILFSVRLFIVFVQERSRTKGADLQLIGCRQTDNFENTM